MSFKHTNHRLLAMRPEYSATGSDLSPQTGMTHPIIPSDNYITYMAGASSPGLDVPEASPAYVSSPTYVTYPIISSHDNHISYMSQASSLALNVSSPIDVTHPIMPSDDNFITYMSQASSLSSHVSSPIDVAHPIMLSEDNYTTYMSEASSPGSDVSPTDVAHPIMPTDDNYITSMTEASSSGSNVSSAIDITHPIMPSEDINITSMSEASSFGSDVSPTDVAHPIMPSDDSCSTRMSEAPSIGSDVISPTMPPVNEPLHTPALIEKVKYDLRHSIGNNQDDRTELLEFVTFLRGKIKNPLKADFLESIVKNPETCRKGVDVPLCLQLLRQLMLTKNMNPMIFDKCVPKSIYNLLNS